ncbi:MAG: YdbH domain-containing protein [Sphingomonadales bacterium]|nr:YdbH domain-containing protein [Sphingomonadales bacterium]
MAEHGDPDLVDEAPARRGSRGVRMAAGTAVAVVLALGLGWSVRERLANRFITHQLDALQLKARYKITTIGAGEQILSDVVLGDPANPDLTIDEVIVSTGLRGGVPGVTGVALVRPRFHGTLANGRVSFGSLDSLLYSPSQGRFRLPDYQLSIIDGRGTIRAGDGMIGLAFTGDGALRDGFNGALGASWPGARFGGCTLGKAVFAGRVTVRGERPGLSGPLDFRNLACGGATARSGQLKLALKAEPALDSASADYRLAGGDVAAGGVHVEAVGGSGNLSVKGGAITARYAIAASRLVSAGFSAPNLGVEGMVRSDSGLKSLTAEGSLAGSNLTPGKALAASLAQAARNADGTLAAPLLAQLSRALARVGAANRLDGQYVLRSQGGAQSVMVPQARVVSGGEPVLALSRFGAARDGKGRLALSGSFQSGGQGLPAIHGRIDSGGLQLAMSEYRAGTARLAMPRMSVRFGGSRTAFAGTVIASGALPGGSAQDLAVPVTGDWNRVGLALWRGCVPVKFARLQLANLALSQQAVTLCPQPGRAIVATGPGGLHVAAGATALGLTGTLAGTPVRLASGPVGFAYPGAMAAKAVDVTLGSGQGASQFRLANLVAKLGGSLAGHFDGAEVKLAAVPIDLAQASGDWRYAGGVLSLDNGDLRVLDRETVARFQPLVAHDATLTLADSRINARATLREPVSDRAVTKLDLTHDLGNGRGQARLAVDGLTFDKGLQPDGLTRLALGVVANASGTVRGQGVIDWTPDKVTSHGRFSTDGLDLAAAFGPAKGISGTVEFTDLLGLVTKPGQVLKIAEINPGIAVEDGTLHYAMLPNHVLAIDGAQWPFLDGRLELLPTRMTLGASEVRRYVLKVSGISAERFVERMEISNLATTGRFDGELPLEFDQNGGWIRGGRLVSRAPGGNVSYVGELTYKDLSAMANFAFQTLRDLDYKTMTIGMDGPLAGELVTRVSMSGVTQGRKAKKNFITRQLARLPIRFDVNVRAPFYQLVTSFKSFYDPNYLPDVRTLGLVDAQGRPIARARETTAAQTIQRSESERRP